jgi:hypothetical protein
MVHPFTVTETTRQFSKIDGIANSCRALIGNCGSTKWSLRFLAHRLAEFGLKFRRASGKLGSMFQLVTQQNS